MTFRLAPLVEGDNPIYWATLQELIGEADMPIQPDASYLPFQEPVELASGNLRGLGYPSAIWLLTGITPAQRYILRQICPGASAEVYVETMTNEYDVSGNREWIQARAVMKWKTGEEDIQADKTLDLEIEFTHLVEVA